MKIELRQVGAGAAGLVVQGCLRDGVILDLEPAAVRGRIFVFLNIPEKAMVAPAVIENPVQNEVHILLVQVVHQLAQ